MEELTQAQHKAAAALYQQAAPAAGAGRGDAAAPGAAAARPAATRSGDVIDAEVVDEGKQCRSMQMQIAVTIEICRSAI